MKLMIYEDSCIGCGQCKSVCIRDNIEIDEVAYETGSNCFECGHCMAICPTGAITLKIFKGHEDRIVEYSSKDMPLNYYDLLNFLKRRRSIRWFKNKKIDKFTFDRIFEGAYYSPAVFVDPISGKPVNENAPKKKLMYFIKGSEPLETDQTFEEKFSNKSPT